MADGTLNHLIRIITDRQAGDVRLAAIQVCGQVGSAKERMLVKALLGALEESEASVRLAAMHALGRLQVDEALPRLAEIIRHGGMEAEAAAHAASQLGAKGARVLDKIMHDAAPGLRSRLTGVLAKSGAGGALVVTAHALLDADPKVAEAAARSLAMEVPSFTSPQRHALAKFLIEQLRQKKLKLSPTSEAGLLRVLSALNDDSAGAVFWERVVPPASTEVRAAALQALGAMHVPPRDKDLPKIVACARDHDFQVVAAALMLLKRTRPTAKNVHHWLTLLDAPDVATRRFAVDQLRGVESKEAARGIAEQVRHPDRDLREAALTTLRSFDAGRAALLDKALAAPTADDAWIWARALAPCGQDVSKPQRTRLFAAACAYHDADDRRAQPLFFLLRELDPAGTRDLLEDKARYLRQKKKYAEAFGYYRLLTHDPACAEEIRFECAALGLKLSNHDLAAETRANEPSLGQFARLLSDAGFDLLGRVSKANWLDAADLFYLGFHFAEQTHRAKEFGKQVLELVISRAGKSEVAKQAKRKLKSEALI